MDRNKMKLKFTIKEIIAGIVVIASISGTWIAIQIKQDNMQFQINKLEKTINEKLNRIENRTDKIYEILINN